MLTSRSSLELSKTSAIFTSKSFGGLRKAFVRVCGLFLFGISTGRCQRTNERLKESKITRERIMEWGNLYFRQRTIAKRKLGQELSSHKEP